VSLVGEIVPRSRLLLVALAVALVIAFGTGWGLGRWHSSSGAHDAFVGSVTLIGGGGSEGCVKPDGGRSQICTAIYLDPSLPVPKIGNHVHAITVPMPVDGGGTAQVLLIYADR
jgi:hypothetical protein